MSLPGRLGSNNWLFIFEYILKIFHCVKFLFKLELAFKKKKFSRLFMIICNWYFQLWRLKVSILSRIVFIMGGLQWPEKCMRKSFSAKNHFEESGFKTFDFLPHCPFHGHTCHCIFYKNLKIYKNTVDRRRFFTMWWSDWICIARRTRSSQV